MPQSIDSDGVDLEASRSSSSHEATADQINSIAGIRDEQCRRGDWVPLRDLPHI
jgi:hypothetical protein